VLVGTLLLQAVLLRALLGQAGTDLLALAVLAGILAVLSAFLARFAPVLSALLPHLAAVRATLLLLMAAFLAPLLALVAPVVAMLLAVLVAGSGGLGRHAEAGGEQGAQRKRGEQAVAVWNLHAVPLRCGKPGCLLHMHYTTATLNRL